jgi:hypothetical protein
MVGKMLGDSVESLSPSRRLASTDCIPMNSYDETKQPKKHVVEFLNDIFNPLERIQKQLTGISERLDKLASFQGPIDPIDNRGA